jgi:predicted phage tail component-like protein
MYFNNKLSDEDLGLIMKDRPNIPIPQRQYNKITVPGRNGYLIEDLGCYSDITITVNFSLLVKPSSYDDFNMNTMEIKDWLCNITDYILRFVDEDYDNCYHVKYIECDAIERKLEQLGYFSIKFICDPFLYDYSSCTQPMIINRSPLTLYNNSSYFSAPYFKIYGSGNITLKVNDTTISFSNVSEYIEIDSEMMNCYKGTLNCNNQMTGDFPMLAVGKNSISYTGTVSKISLLPRWRYL